MILWFFKNLAHFSLGERSQDIENVILQDIKSCLLLKDPHLCHECMPSKCTSEQDCINEPQSCSSGSAEEEDELTVGSLELQCHCSLHRWLSLSLFFLQIHAMLMCACSKCMFSAYAYHTERFAKRSDQPPGEAHNPNILSHCYFATN